MPLARFALYESGVEIYVASTADDGDAWQATLVHIARESRAFVVSPSPLPARRRRTRRTSRCASSSKVCDVIGRGGSAILGPDGSYLAGPLYDEEGILYAELDPPVSSRSGSVSTRQGTTTARTSSASRSRRSASRDRRALIE